MIDVCTVLERERAFIFKSMQRVRQAQKWRRIVRQKKKKVSEIKARLASNKFFCVRRVSRVLYSPANLYTAEPDKHAKGDFANLVTRRIKVCRARMLYKLYSNRRREKPFCGYIVGNYIYLCRWASALLLQQLRPSVSRGYTIQLTAAVHNFRFLANYFQRNFLVCARYINELFITR